MRKTHSMFYAYLQCSVASVLPRGMGLSPGFYFIFYLFGSLEREPSLWENTWPWEILRTWESFPGIRLGNQDLWGGEKESTFDTGRRVETGTYHWEGRKPFIQTFEQKDCCWPILAPNWLGFSVSMFPTSISGRRTKRYPNMEMIGWCLVDVFSCFFPYHGNFRGHWWTMWEHHCSTKGWYGGMGSSCPRRSSGYSCDASKHSLDTGQTTSNIQYVLSGKPLGWFLGNKTLKIANVAAFYVLQHQGCKCVLFFQPHMAALQQPLLCRNQIPSNWW